MKKTKKKDVSDELLFDKEECLSDLEVDIDNIVEQWAQQPTLYLNYALRLSTLIKKRSKIRQKLTRKIMANPEDFGLSKISDAAVERALAMDDELIDINYEVDNHNWAVKAFEHRKKALEYEAQLLQGGFHAEPKEKKERRE